jgi:hypothetical protein
VMLCSSSLYVLLYIVQTGGIELHDVHHLAVLIDKVSNTDFRLKALWGSCYQPLAFIAFGMFVGLLVEEDKKKIRQLARAIAKQQELIAEKDSAISQVLGINAAISDQLVKVDQSFNIFFEKTKKIFSKDLMNIYDTAYELLKTSLPDSKGAVFYLQDDHFELAYPENAQKEGALFLTKNAEQVAMVRETHHFIRLDLIEEHNLSEQSPIFMGPILHQATDTLYGLLVVEELDFARYNDNTFRTFKNLCKWIGEILYFRSQHYAATTPIDKRRSRFPYIVEFGATRSQIQQLIKQTLDED